MELCKNCQLWEPKEESGICRKYAPKPIVMEEGNKYTIVWPTTQGHEFCGEFEPCV